MYRLRFFLAAAATVLLADQFTKRWIQGFLEDRSCGQTGNCEELFSGVRLRLLFNNGAAFSTGEGFGRWFALAAVFVLIFLGFLAWRRTLRLQGLTLGIVAGGAAGNLYDRLLRSDGDGIGAGAVVDFIDIGPWPVFNLADSAITVGAIALVFIGFDNPTEDVELETDLEGDESRQFIDDSTDEDLDKRDLDNQDLVDDAELDEDGTILETEEVELD